MNRSSSCSTMRTVYADQGSSADKALDSISAAFARSKRAVVLVGAGISTNAGIPVRCALTSAFTVHDCC